MAIGKKVYYYCSGAKKMLSLLECSMTVAQLYHDYSMTVA